MNTLRALQARIPTSDHSIIERGSIPIITQQSGMAVLIVGQLANLVIEDGNLVGDIEFTGRYAEASTELFQSNEREPTLTISMFGVCLTF